MFMGGRRMALVALAIATVLCSIGCDEWEPALGVGLDNDGTPVIYPVLCGGETAMRGELLDLGVTEYDDISDDRATVIWRVESEGPGDASGALVAGQPGADFVETLPLNQDIRAWPPNRWLRVKLDVLRGERLLAYQEDYEVGDFEQSTVYARFYGLLSRDEWEKAKQDEICDEPYPGLIAQAADATNTPRQLWTALVLVGGVGILFGIAWLGKKLGRPRPTAPSDD
jgi:hypothetical protein